MTRTFTILLFLAMSLLAGQVPAATTFKIATVAPDGTSWMVAMRAAAEEIQQRTEGRVVLRFYPGGIMGNDKSVLRKIRVGQLHGGALTGGGLADILPDAQVYSIPFVFRSYAEVDYAREKVDPILLERLKEKGYIGFGISEGGFAYLMSETAVSGPDDLQGHKVWVPEGDEISRTAFEATGTSPVSLPLTDVLTGLQTGLIDTVAATPTGAIALQWHTRVKHLTDEPLMYIYGTLVLKRSVFERLSKGDQAIVSEVLGTTFGELDHQNRADNESARNALLGQGITSVAVDDQTMGSWRSTVNAAMDKLIDNGLFDQALYLQLQEHLQTFRAQQTAE